MSRFLLPRLQTLAPYVPGEQPRDRQYVKLNTNENPFPPSPRVLEALNREAISALNLYPDPLAADLRAAIAGAHGLGPERVFVGNGSDEVLGFAFLAYADAAHPVVMPEVSYGFYRVFSQLFGVAPVCVPLNDDFTLPVERFFRCGATVVLANPNAPTGIALSRKEIERIVAGNPDSLVLVDEAYADFCAETALPLLDRYDNLLIVRTFSKSYSLAGGRLGYAFASPAIIDDLERVKSSFHPYSVNRLTLLAGIEAVRDRAYFRACVDAVVAQREKSARALREMGFTLTESSANFLFAAPPKLGGREYYERLKARGVLVRYLSHPTLKRYVRITVGTRAQMDALLAATKEILREAQT